MPWLAVRNARKDALARDPGPFYMRALRAIFAIPLLEYSTGS
jgi:hypothetical protein